MGLQYSQPSRRSHDAEELSSAALDCPMDGGLLCEDDGGLVECPKCGRAWRVTSGWLNGVHYPGSMLRLVRDENGTEIRYEQRS